MPAATHSSQHSQVKKPDKHHRTVVQTEQTACPSTTVPPCSPSSQHWNNWADVQESWSAETRVSSHGQLLNSTGVPKMWQLSCPSSPVGSPHGDSQTRKRQFFPSIAVTQNSTQVPPACPQQCLASTSHSLQPAWCGRGAVRGWAPPY